MTDLKRSSYRRLQWEKKIDFFASDLLVTLGSNIEISTYTKEKVKLRINKLKDEINRAKISKESITAMTLIMCSISSDLELKSCQQLS